MIAIDTNALMRFLIRDDADQYEIAADLVKACTLDEPGFICREVILELVWVLERSISLIALKLWILLSL